MSASSSSGSSGLPDGSADSSSSLSASERRIRRIVAEFERSLRESFPKENEPKTLEQIEQLTDKIGEAAKESIQRDAIEQQSHGFDVSRVSCLFCQRARGARHRGEQTRQVVTLHGTVSFVRAYYYCATCKKGFCPLDRQLGIGSGQLSASVVALLCRFATYLSFREAAREIEIVCGVHLSHSTVTRYAAAVGEQLQQTHEARREKVRRALEASDPGEQDKISSADLRPIFGRLVSRSLWTEF